MTGKSSRTREELGLDPPPQGVLDIAAVAQHEVVMSYERAGFTREEAMKILIAMITSSAATGWAKPA